MSGSIAVLDFGSQYSQLIARRVRELNVYAELFPWDAPAAEVLAAAPCGFILSGGPASAYESGAPFIEPYVLESGLPILGICYGMQALTHALGGQVAPAARREYGTAIIDTLVENPLLDPADRQVWMSHGDRIESLPPGFTCLASSPNSPFAAMGHLESKRYGLQFHPEVRHTPTGEDILRRFVLDICAAPPDWTSASIIQHSVETIRRQVGGRRVLAAVSGGVDSSVATALTYRAVGSQMVGVFVDTGLLRQGERQQVEADLKLALGIDLHTVDASQRFFTGLKGVTEPEAKRRIIGGTFIDVFTEEARRLGSPSLLVQGTIYPDVVESRAPERSKSHRIKSHHNVGGLPDVMAFELVEPLRYLFKDEVRRVGEVLGLSRELVWRQPFPGPGLAVRCLGEVTPGRIERLRQADAIFTTELAAAGLLHLQESPGGAPAGSSQAFAVLLPVQSVGVMGDQRTYQEAVALRAVTTDDFMTADWCRLPEDLLGRVSSRIVNEVAGINRVVYDITSKPPATIEWE